MNDKTRGWLLAGVLAVLAVGTIGLAAGATTGDLLTENVTVDNDTETVYLDVTNVSGGPVNVTFYGVDSDDTETQVLSKQIDAVDDNTTTTSVDANASAYEEYRIVVNEDGSDASAESIGSYEVGKTVRSSGGGGLFAGGGGGLLSPMNILIGSLLFGGAYVVGILDPVIEYFQ